MPKNLVLRCKICGRIIQKFKRQKRYITLDEKMREVRRHYRKFHPKEWKDMLKRAKKLKAPDEDSAIMSIYIRDYLLGDE